MNMSSGGSESALGPYMRMIPPSEVDARNAVDEKQQQEHVRELALHLKLLWDDAKEAKTASMSGGLSVEQNILADYRQRSGLYSADKLESIRQQGGSEVFVSMTSAKCRAAESILYDVVSPDGEKAWKITPTPIPDISRDAKAEAERVVSAEMQSVLGMFGGNIDQNAVRKAAKKRTNEVRKAIEAEILEEAKDIAMGMELLIEDQLVEGGYDLALRDTIADMVCTRAGILKGPIVRRRKKMKWASSEDGSFTPEVADELCVEFERRSPLDIYPSRSAVSIQDGYLFDKLKLGRPDLSAMKGCEGYDTDAINAVLDEYGLDGVKVEDVDDSARAVVEGRQQSRDDKNAGEIEALEFWGGVPGGMLLEWGLSEEDVPDKHEEYQINAIMIGEYVVKAVINPHPVGHRPYGKASFDDIPGSFWGRGVTDLMRDCQDVCNAATRALVNNLSIASGPQVVVDDVARLPDGEDVTQMFPWKVWQFTGGMNTGRSPVTFFQPPSNALDLISVLDRFTKLADDVSGVPSVTYSGQAQGGAASTASGLSMLLGQTTRTVKAVVENIDNGVVRPAIEALYMHNMMFHPDDYVKGDMSVVSKGSGSLVAKEQNQIRRQEFLNSTANPIDMQIIGVRGRAALLRASASVLDLPVEDIVPSKEDIESSMMPMAQEPPVPGEHGGDGRQQNQLPGPQALDPAGNEAGGEKTATF